MGLALLGRDQILPEAFDDLFDQPGALGDCGATVAGRFEFALNTRRSFAEGSSQFAG